MQKLFFYIWSGNKKWSRQYVNIKQGLFKICLRHWLLVSLKKDSNLIGSQVEFHESIGRLHKQMQGAFSAASDDDDELDWGKFYASSSAIKALNHSVTCVC